MKTADEIRYMLMEAVDKRAMWLEVLAREQYANKQEFREAVRNYNALRGVVKSLRWVLLDMESPLD
jgi:hypothetical protein